MSFESFYGGRMGASFIIVDHFDGIDIPQPNDYTQKIYKVKIYATTGTGANLKYLVDSEGNLIEKNGSNYQNYTWTYTTLKGGTINTVSESDPSITGTIFLPRLLARGMVQCFEQGGDSTNQVNYGEYVIIDTYEGLARRDDPDNGKVFRRGMNYQGELAGAEYIGQIVGPQGECTDIEIAHYNDITGESHQYTVNGNDLIPGKYDEDGEPQFNDAINYKYVNLRDNYGNIDKAFIGFQIPYNVTEIIGRQRSAYDNNGDILPSDFELVERIDDTNHPFYQKWKINIPHGIKGDTLTDLEPYPKMIKEGTNVYRDIECTQLYGTVGLGGAELDFLSEEATDLVCPLKTEGVDKYYVKLQNSPSDPKFDNGEELHLRYKKYNYDSNIDGDYIYQDAGFYDVITNTYIQTKADSQSEEGSGDQKIHIEVGKKDDNPLGEPLNYILDTFLVPQVSTEDLPMSTEQLKHKGELLVYYSDPQRRRDYGIFNLTFPSVRLNDDVEGWVSLGDIHGLTYTPLTFHDYTTEQISAGGPYDITYFSNNNIDAPEVEMNNDPKYRGYGAIYTTDNTGELKRIAEYDYKTGVWKDSCPLGGSMNDPREVIALANDINNLYIHGFKMNSITRKAIDETTDVIIDLAQKNVNNTFTSHYLGTEPKYIGAQRNSNDNNLEEQLIIGTDAHSTIEYSNVNNEPNKIQKVETTTFNVNGSSSNYYQIVKTIIMERPTQIDATNKKLILKSDPYIYTHTEELKYQGSSGTPVSVSSKLTTYTDNTTTQTRTINANITNSL